jgi:hypothetical protein
MSPISKTPAISRDTSNSRNSRNNKKFTSSMAAINSIYASSRYAERARTPTTAAKTKTASRTPTILHIIRSLKVMSSEMNPAKLGLICRSLMREARRFLEKLRPPPILRKPFKYKTVSEV